MEDTRDTKTRILDTAEHLFADQGISATSLRAITNEAGVNLAAVNYHFGSKDLLILETFRRRIGPLNRARLAGLDELETAEATTGEPPTLEQVLETFFGPALRMFSNPERRSFMKLLGRVFSEPSEALQKMFVGQMIEVAQRYRAALSRLLPHLPPDELLWRMHFMIGSMAHTLGCGHFLTYVSDGACDTRDVEGTVQRLIEFAAAGLSAPLGSRTSSGRHELKGHRKSRTPSRGPTETGPSRQSAENKRTTNRGARTEKGQP